MNDSFESINNSFNNQKKSDLFEEDFSAEFNHKEEFSLSLFNTEQKKNDNFPNNLNIFTSENPHEFPDNQNKNQINIHNLGVNQSSKKKKFHVYEDIRNSYSINSIIDETENVKKYKCEHPGCNIRFRTMKLKIYRHDMNNTECKLDMVYMLQMIYEVKKILKRNIARKNKTKYKSLRSLYKKCIKSIPHKDYFVNIVGDKL